MIHKILPPNKATQRKAIKLKISFIEPHLKQYGGIRRIIEISNHLTKRGHDVTIFHSDGSSCEWLHGEAKTKASREVLKENHDVLIFNDPNPTDLFLAKNANAKLKMYYILGLYEKELLTSFLKSRLFGKRKTRILREVLTSSSYTFIANATWEQKWVKEYLGLSSELTLGGINTMTFYPTEGKKNKDAITILCSGDKRIGKGTDVIKKGVAMAKKKDSRIILKTYSGKGIPQKDMASVYSSADIFIEASTHGGWNNPVAEAMACKTPVICTNIGAVQDFAFHKNTALLVPTENPIAISEAIILLTKDHLLRQQLITNAYRQIRKFEWHKTADQFESILYNYLK